MKHTASTVDHFLTSLNVWFHESSSEVAHSERFFDGCVGCKVFWSSIATLPPYSSLFRVYEETYRHDANQEFVLFIADRLKVDLTLWWWQLFSWIVRLNSFRFDRFCIVRSLSRPKSRPCDKKSHHYPSLPLCPCVHQAGMSDMSELPEEDNSHGSWWSHHQTMHCQKPKFSCAGPIGHNKGVNRVRCAMPFEGRQEGKLVNGGVGL